MFPEFLPASVQKLTETPSIEFAQKLQRIPIQTPLKEEPITTSYVQQGNSGEPMLLLHGFDSSLFEYRRLFPRLSETNSVWAVDLLGFGFTERDAQLKLNPETITTHLYCFWKTVIRQPVVLVGASMGGAVALDFVLNYPEAVRALVLIDSAGMSAGPVLGKFLYSPLDYLATEFLRNPRVRQSISQNAYFDPKFASEDARICAALHLEAPGWSKALANFTRNGGFGSYQQRLSEIQQPTLILWGENDRILGIKDAAKLQKGIPNSQLIWIEKCGHVPHLEKSEIVSHHILNFFD